MKFWKVRSIALCAITAMWSPIWMASIAAAADKEDVDTNAKEMSVNRRKYNAIMNSGDSEYHKILKEVSIHKELEDEVISSLFEGSALDEMSILLFLKKNFESKIKKKCGTLIDRINAELDKGHFWLQYQTFAQDRPTTLNELLHIISLNASTNGIDINDVPTQFELLSTRAKALIFERYSDLDCQTPYDRIHNFNVALESTKNFAQAIGNNDISTELGKFSESNIGEKLRFGLETSDFTYETRNNAFNNYINIAAMSFPNTAFKSKLNSMSPNMLEFMNKEMDPYKLAGPTELLRDILSTLDKATKTKDLKDEALKIVDYLKKMSKAANIELDSLESIRENKIHLLTKGSKEMNNMAETELMLMLQNNVSNIVKSAGKSHIKSQTESELKKVLKKAKNIKTDVPRGENDLEPFSSMNLFEQLTDIKDFGWVEDLKNLASKSTALHGTLYAFNSLPIEFLKTINMPDLTKMPESDAMIKACEAFIKAAEVDGANEQAQKTVLDTFHSGNVDYGTHILHYENIVDTENMSDAAKFARYTHMATFNLQYGHEARALLLNVPTNAQEAILKAMDKTSFTPSECYPKLRDSLRTVTGELAEKSDVVSKSTVRMLASANGLMQAPSNGKLGLIILPLLFLIGGASFYGMLNHKQKAKPVNQKYIKRSRKLH